MQTTQTIHFHKKDRLEVVRPTPGSTPLVQVHDGAQCDIAAILCFASVEQAVEFGEALLNEGLNASTACEEAVLEVADA